MITLVSKNANVLNPVADLGGALKRPRRAHEYGGLLLPSKKNVQGFKKLLRKLTQLG